MPTRKRRNGGGAREKKNAKGQTLTQSAPSQARSVADALVIKDKNLYFVSLPGGNVPANGKHGFGLYYKDCRWLDGYELEVAGSRPNTLMASDEKGTECVLQMTNLRGKNFPQLEKDSLGLRSVRRLSEENLRFQDQITIKNYARWRQKFVLRVMTGARFEDVFEVRSLSLRKLPRVRPKQAVESLCFRRRGIDGTLRSAEVRFSRRPRFTSGNAAEFTLDLGPGEEWELGVTVSLREESVSLAPGKNILELTASRSVRDGATSWLDRMAYVETDHDDVNRILGKSFRDLRMLRSTLLGEEYVSAGIPWFGTLFGRDSLITAMQLLPFDRGCAADTLRLLAKMQADQRDPFRDAEPGKILHEMRVGELASAGKIPHTPYYGTVDATPLFLILLGKYCDWDGSVQLFRELRGSAEAALQWIERIGNRDDQGFLQYDSPRSARKGLVNQGWKDAGNSILDGRGKVPDPPIALVEVQAYACEALERMAALFEQTGERTRAETLRKKARQWRSRLNRFFWSERRGIFGMARTGRARLLEVVASNAGHVLWTGAADRTKAAKTVATLMEDHMFAGWGVRTLSSREKAFNPLGYHLGTIWPHDNAILAEGFRRYGFDEEALRIFEGITAAALHHRDGRLPEVFGGYSRQEFPKPVRYPVACSPQAWAAGSYPHLLSTLLGLRARALEGSLQIERPLLPRKINYVSIKNMSVGEAAVDLEFSRDRGGEVACKVIRKSGAIEVECVSRATELRAAG